MKGEETEKSRRGRQGGIEGVNTKGEETEKSKRRRQGGIEGVDREGKETRKDSRGRYGRGGERGGEKEAEGGGEGGLRNQPSFLSSPSGETGDSWVSNTFPGGYYVLEAPKVRILEARDY